MKYSVLFSLGLLAAACGWWFSPAGAQENYWRDVPEGHYAYDAVYDLVHRGVTNGFPDGTYRGRRAMTRFEIAAFITKLAQSFNQRRGATEKIIAELKSEAALLKVERETDTIVTGRLDARWRRAAKGSAADYRLRTKIEKTFGDLADLKVNFDTMDGGFDNGARDLARELLDFEGRVKLGGGTLKFLAGPGDLPHRPNGLFPWESAKQYRRPRRSVGYYFSRGKSDLALDYLAWSSNASGAVTWAEFSPKLTQRNPWYSLSLNPRWFQDDRGERDIYLELSAESKFGQLLVGAARTTDLPHGLYAKGTLTLGDNFYLVAQKVGSRYRQQFSYNIFDLFDRSLADGGASVGGWFNVGLPSGFYGKLTGDYTLPGEVVTGEFRLGRKVSTAQTFEIIYLGYRTANYSQAFGVASAVSF